MPHRHKCEYCGKQAVASDEGPSGTIYLCADHIPTNDVDEKPVPLVATNDAQPANDA